MNVGVVVVVFALRAFGVHIRFGRERGTRDQALKHDRDEGENFDRENRKLWRKLLREK